jgi:gamma-glutamyltranspeptidase/glutathione hydrolase
MHTLNDYLVHDAHGNLVLVGGTPGGAFQIQHNIQHITDIIDYGMSLTEAIDFPRFKLGENMPARGEAGRPPSREPVLRIEARLPQSVFDELSAMGHKVERDVPWDEHSGGGAVQMIALDPKSGVYRGVAEARRSDSTVSGF